MLNVVDRISGDGTFRALAARIRELSPPAGATGPANRTAGGNVGGVVCADGLWGSFAPILAGALAINLGRPLLYVTAHLDPADEVRDDLELFCGRTPELFSAFEAAPGEGAASDEIHAERIRLCAKLRQSASLSRLQAESPQRRAAPAESAEDRGDDFDKLSPRKPLGSSRSGSETAPTRKDEHGGTSAAPTLGHATPGDERSHDQNGRRPWFIVAPIQALMQCVPTPEAMAAHLLTLSVNQEHEPQELARWLVDHGYARLDQVESPGDFALRGDILDIYPPAEPDPYRIDFFGSQIESIRRFDVSTQRSDQEFDTIQVAAVSLSLGKRCQDDFSAAAQATRRTHAENHPEPRPSGAKNHPDTFFSKRRFAESSITSFLSYLPPDTIIAFDEPGEIQEIGKTFWNRLNGPPGMMPVHRVFQRAGGFTQLHLNRLAGAGIENRFNLGVQSLARFETKSSEAIGELARLAGERDVLLYCDNEPERERFIELWKNTMGDLPPRLELPIGLMHRGFDWPDGRLAVVGHHEVFHRYTQRRRIRKWHAARPVESWLDLNPGDFVVHVVHGIARFQGMRTMRKGDSEKQEEYLTLEFAEAARLHVPVSQIDLVQKYIGAGTAAPPLSKLGGTRWTKTKERVEESVGDLAADLLHIQAARSSQPGIAYPADTLWQREFEGSFIYTETEDQLASLTDIKQDMSRPQPMDRLLCGDVGYGKTELAIRAAFKAVEYGKQVAVLVPTTVLAEQHERTFQERLADYPFAVESLSRFKTKKAQSETIDRARKGQVDVLIGTHRLLSKDVAFKDLGLLIIDEEQRFGVEHKERLKRFRETMDVLTMTATPIPRTLHMSLLGIRDISSLATPPMDRRSIVTQVVNWSEQLIRDAILRELNRDGQVFFVHNFVYDIQSFADTVKRIVPEARVIVGHGQMHEHELERVMLQFVRHEADVLVCTTIIESGLDIPNCNTILIDRAERFGLSELHQLRGRVGRYKHRAYCYLLLSPDKAITPNAARRLKAIEEYSDLGAGFRIAMRDLEIRGAGNILGPEQSGHIAAVGYELYCQLLDQAVRRLKNEPAEEFRPVHLELDIPAFIPRNYIESDRQRMEIYRRVVRSRSLSELEQLDKDVKDAFGPYPQALADLLALAEIRILAQPFRIRAINKQPPDLVFSVEELALVEPIFTDSPGSARMADAHTIHLRLTPAYFEPATLLAVLRRLLQQQKIKLKMPAS